MKTTKILEMMDITDANESDLPKILALQYLAYQSEAKLLGNPNIPPLCQTLEEVRREFQTGFFLKMTDETGEILGSVRGHSEGTTLFIGKLFVHPDHQGQGYGTRLLREIQTRFPHPRYELFTSTQSVANIRLYERLGFRPFREQTLSDTLKLVYLEKSVPSNTKGNS